MSSVLENKSHNIILCLIPCRNRAVVDDTQEFTKALVDLPSILTSKGLMKGIRRIKESILWHTAATAFVNGWMDRAGELFATAEEMDRHTTSTDNHNRRSVLSRDLYTWPYAYNAR